jgi:hypothetical protein
VDGGGSSPPTFTNKLAVAAVHIASSEGM